MQYCHETPEGCKLTLPAELIAFILSNPLEFYSQIRGIQEMPDADERIQEALMGWHPLQVESSLLQALLWHWSERWQPVCTKPNRWFKFSSLPNGSNELAWIGDPDLLKWLVDNVLAQLQELLPNLDLESNSVASVHYTYDLAPLYAKIKEWETVAFTRTTLFLTCRDRQLEINLSPLHADVLLVSGQAPEAWNRALQTIIGGGLGIVELKERPSAAALEAWHQITIQNRVKLATVWWRLPRDYDERRVFIWNQGNNNFERYARRRGDDLVRNNVQLNAQGLFVINQRTERLFVAFQQLIKIERPCKWFTIRAESAAERFHVQAERGEASLDLEPRFARWLQPEASQELTCAMRTKIAVVNRQSQITLGRLEDELDALYTVYLKEQIREHWLVITREPMVQFQLQARNDKFYQALYEVNYANKALGSDFQFEIKAQTQGCMSERTWVGHKADGTGFHFETKSHVQGYLTENCWVGPKLEEWVVCPKSVYDRVASLISSRFDLSPAEPVEALRLQFNDGPDRFCEWGNVMLQLLLMNPNGSIFIQ